MPHFYFNVRDGRDIEDQEGIDLPDLKAARREAVRLSGAILENEADHIVDDWKLEVTNEAGLILLVVTFSIMQSSAVPLSWAASYRDLKPTSSETAVDDRSGPRLQ